MVPGLVGCMVWLAPALATDNPTHANDLAVVAQAASHLRAPAPQAAFEFLVAQSVTDSEPPSQTFWTRDTILGNWGGARTRFSEQGIDLNLSHWVEVLGVVSGGREQFFAYSGSTLLFIDLYTAPLGWWEGGQFHSIVGWFEGPSVARDFAGAFNSSYFFDPSVNGITVFELWYGHTWALSSESTVEVRLGKVYPFFAIANSGSANLFSNASFRYPHFMGTIPGYGGSFMGSATAFLIAPYGVQVLYSPNSRWDLTLSVMDGFFDPSGGLDNRYGLNLDLNKREGVEIIAEVARHTQFNGRAGTYRLGFQGHTGLFDIPATTDSRRGNYAFFVVADQTLFQEAEGADQGLDTFFKIYHIPQQDLNTISWNISAGLVYQGLIDRRSDDQVGIGITHTVFSEGVRRFDLEAEQSPRRAETVIEAVYSAKITPW